MRRRSRIGHRRWADGPTVGVILSDECTSGYCGSVHPSTRGASSTRPGRLPQWGDGPVGRRPWLTRKSGAGWPAAMTGVFRHALGQSGTGDVSAAALPGQARSRPVEPVAFRFASSSDRAAVSATYRSIPNPWITCSNAACPSRPEAGGPKPGGGSLDRGSGCPRPARGCRSGHPPRSLPCLPPRSRRWPAPPTAASRTALGTPSASDGWTKIERLAEP